MAKQGNIGRGSQDDTRECPECKARMQRAILVCGKSRIVWKCEGCGHFDNTLRKIDVEVLLRKAYPTIYQETT